jgi:hypothetical protein
LKPNYIGIIGGILAFVSLALPWWTMTMSSTLMGLTYSVDVSVYPYQARASALGFSTTVAMELWFGWVALALIVLGGVLGLVGSLMLAKGKMLIAVGGILALLSVIVFAVGLQIELSKTAPLEEGPMVGLFSSGSYNLMEISMNYSTYLSFGFWIALIAAIIMLIAAKKAPIETAPAPTPPPPPPPPPT